MSSKHIHKIDSIIFDLDGTLWDSTEVVYEAWKEVLSKRKEVREPITRYLLKSFMGLQIHQIRDKYLNYLTEEEGTKIIKECGEFENKRIREVGGMLYLELENTLKAISEEIPLFIVSNCDCGYIESFLEFHKLRKYFKDFECAGNTGLSKGENIKLIIERNKLENPIYVGDTQMDCDAAEFADIPFVYAAYGFGAVEEYSYSISHFKEIIEVKDIPNWYIE